MEKKMPAAIVQKSSDVRDQWSTFIDAVIYKSPKFVQRNHKSNDIFLMMNLHVAKDLLEKYRFEINIEHDKEAQEYIATIDDIWIVESGKTEKEAIKNYLTSFIDWSKDYFNEFDSNYRAPNLRPQLPLVMKALIINDVENLLKYTDVQYP
ncbi:hypothetical protein OYT88_12330 [Sporolactobacillus sp. CQH2019]|uniref:hypothetical protein n=1 Tax=Sporolactobacillus sp. CQH2019 TaxID=3023512 RepID=UPI00236827E9|nr:hypothetical protein [Sporolactobacillus sp. CQH2019]MDD9149328.1 hypothetical protein [Sporolactobacillus sp. CQH2019]